jgi:hypothetical protein
MIDMVDDQYEHDDNLHNLDLPAREELWVAVKEAHDYLQEYVNDVSTHTHPVYGAVVFDSGVWGIPLNDEECWVCLAGLRYLRKEGGLLGLEKRVSDTDRFLDALRCPYYYKEHIKHWLGVEVPYSLTSLHGLDEPEEILSFLGWLLEQHRDNALGANDNVR